MTEDLKLPAGWKLVKLGEIAERIKEVHPNGSQPYLEIGDIDIKSKRYTIKEKPSPEHCLKVRKNYIVISKVRPMRGAIAKIKEEYLYVSPALLVLNSDNNDFLFYALSKEDFFNYLGTRETGTTYPSVNDRDVLDFEFLLPSISEQRKIAEILENIDETIEKTDAIIEKYKQIKQGLMQDLLTRGIDENGQIRSEETHKFKDSPLGRIPEEWEVKRIIDAIGVKRSLIIAGPFGSNLKVSDYKKSGIPLIRLQNIEENKFINKDIKYVSKKKAKELYYHSFKNGDIVLAKLGIPVGKTCIIPKNLKFGIVVADVVRIRVIDECADKEFITYILNFNTCRKRLNMEIIGTTRPRVNLTQIRSLQLPLPPLPEQRRIVSILSQTDETIEKEQRYKEKLERIKQGLMKELLTGKLRVNHLIKEGVESV